MCFIPSEDTRSSCEFSPIEIIYWLNRSHDHHTQTSWHWQTVSGVTVNKRELKDPASPTPHHGLPSLKRLDGHW